MAERLPDPERYPDRERREVRREEEIIHDSAPVDDLTTRRRIIRDDLPIDEVERRRVIRRRMWPARGETEEHMLVEHPTWSPAQIVALVIGVLFLALGGIALARGGFSDMTAQFEVMGFSHTPILAIIHLVFGALLIMAGAIPGADRGLMSFLGAVALVWGIIVVAQPATFTATLGTRSEHGWVYLVVGVVLLLAGLLSPVVFGRERYERRRY